MAKDNEKTNELVVGVDLGGTKILAAVITGVEVSPSNTCAANVHRPHDPLRDRPKLVIEDPHDAVVELTSSGDGEAVDIAGASHAPHLEAPAAFNAALAAFVRGLPDRTLSRRPTA